MSGETGLAQRLQLERVGLSVRVLPISTNDLDEWKAPEQMVATRMVRTGAFVRWRIRVCRGTPAPENLCPQPSRIARLTRLDRKTISGAERPGMWPICGRLPRLQRAGLIPKSFDAEGFAQGL